MTNCKALTTLMTKKLKLLNDDTSEAVDATSYIQIIGSLMYLTNTRLDICFVVNTPSQYMVTPKHIHTSRKKRCDEVSKGDFRLWS